MEELENNGIQKLSNEEIKQNNIERKKQEKELKNLHAEMIKNEELHRKEPKEAPLGAYISLNNINKVYPNHIQAVFDFNLDIERHEFVVFVGPSGCGKSTTLRMIAGLEDITTGDLFIDGMYSNEKTAKERDVAMVFQNYALYPHMSVYENLAFGLQLRNYPKDKIDEQVQKAAKVLQITDYLKRKPKELSGGQQQRVALGRAIVRDAKVFLMDEPLSNLDAKLRVTMRTEIINLHKAINATTIYVTHDQTEAMTMADRIVVMKDGYIQQIGNPETIYNHPENLFVATFIGAPPMNLIDGTYNNGIIEFSDGFTIELDAKQIKKHDAFYKEQIKLLKSDIENEVYKLPDMNLLLTMHKEKFSLKSLFKKKEEFVKIKTADEKLAELEDRIKLYEEYLKNPHKIVFGVRPESIYEKDVVDPNIKLSNSFKTKVKIAELLGSEYYIYVDYCNTTLVAKFKSNKKMEEGKSVNIAYDLNSIHLFDAVNTKSIF